MADGNSDFMRMPAPSAGLDVAEILTIGPEGDEEIEPTEDGGFIATLGENDEGSVTPDDDGFYTNLATVIPDYKLTSIATDLLEKVDDDKRAREERDKQYEEGIRRTGLGKDAPGGAQFQGASKVVHPMITEACVDFESRIISELWPPSGPVRKNLVGKATKEKEEQAQRKTDYMNWQLGTQIAEAFSVFEVMLTQLPLGGSQFIRLWQDHGLKRPES